MVRRRTLRFSGNPLWISGTIVNGGCQGRSVARFVSSSPPPPRDLTVDVSTPHSIECILISASFLEKILQQSRIHTGFDPTWLDPNRSPNNAWPREPVLTLPHKDAFRAVFSVSSPLSQDRLLTKTCKKSSFGNFPFYNEKFVKWYV